MSFTGEPVDSETLAFAEATFGTRLCSMYGTTEVGVILADYPGAGDHVPKAGALGKPVPGVKVEVQAPDGTPARRAKSAKSRSGAMTPGFRPRIAAGSMRMGISGTPAGPTTSSFPPAGPSGRPKSKTPS